ncbi:MAG: hypothetical protein L7U83_09710 [Akkermansiaceae bacterium]|nr:hypothetical protein [Akkermansiaceae bacterium]
MILLTIEQAPTSPRPPLIGRSQLPLVPQQPLMADPSALTRKEKPPKVTDTLRSSLSKVRGCGGYFRSSAAARVRCVEINSQRSKKTPTYDPTPDPTTSSSFSFASSLELF